MCGGEDTVGGDEGAAAEGHAAAGLDDARLPRILVDLGHRAAHYPHSGTRDAAVCVERKGSIFLRVNRHVDPV